MTPEARVIESLLFVPDKYSRDDVPFKLNSAQRRIDEGFSNRLIVPKARQEGVSFYFVARKLVRCLYRKNTRAVIISHDADATQKHLARVDYLLSHMREGLKAQTDTHNKNEITFPKTDSTIYIGTAGSRKFGRGDTITDLFCTEVAFWPDAGELMSGLLNAVPKGTGEIAIESTGNGMGDWFHKRCMNAVAGRAPEKLIFLPWWDFPEYTLSNVPDDIADALMGNLNESWGEPELVKQLKLGADRLMWRRSVIEDHDFDIATVNQEYPSFLHDCFKASGFSLFHNVNFVSSPKWEKRAPGYWALNDHPKVGHRYVAGCDVAAGVGNDSSTIQIFDLDDDEQVAEFGSDRIEPDVFGRSKIPEICDFYNKAFVGVEVNNHGILTIAELRKAYPTYLIYNADPTANLTKTDEIAKLSGAGIRTSSRTKPFIIGALRKAISNRTTIHSPILLDQLQSFVEHEDGKLGAQSGAHDDYVIGAAMAKYVETRAILVLPKETDRSLPAAVKESQFLFDNILKEFERKRSGQFPIRSQEGYNAY